MKTYFTFRTFLWNARYSSVAAVKFKSYKIGGLETLTTQYFIDNQNVGVQNPAANFEYCMQNPEGNLFFPSTPNLAFSTNFNPFILSMGLSFPEITPLIHRGKCSGALNGNDYGEGLKNLYCDKQLILDAQNTIPQGHCVFALDIDYTKDLYVEVDIIANYHDGQLYRSPDVYQSFKIEWNKETCKGTFERKNINTVRDTPKPNAGNDNGNYNVWIDNSREGFLSGKTAVDNSNLSPLVGLSGLCNICTDCGCEDKELTRSFALFVNLPSIEEPVDTINECCYKAEVFAELTGNDYEKNDFTGIWHKRQIPNEQVEFLLIDISTGDEYEINTETYGTYKDFETIEGSPNLSIAIIEWKKVLQEIGEGTYTILKRISIAGVDYEEADINYTLRVWSSKRADKSVRIDVKADGYMERLGVDFKNSNYRTSIRFGGFFGRREAKYEEDNIVYNNFVSTQISMMQTNEYVLQSDLLPSCITQPLFDFLLFANDIYLNDYNWNNHLRNFVKFPVKFGENKGTGYFSTTTKAILNLTFTDKKVDNIKRNY